MIEQAIDDKREEQRERGEEREDREMKPERLQSAGSPVIDREQRRDKRSIRLIAGERAKRCRVAKEERNISQLPNGRVVYDRVRVVEVEAVVKMVSIGREEGKQQQRTAQTRKGFSARHFRLGFSHQSSVPR